MNHILMVGNPSELHTGYSLKMGLNRGVEVKESGCLPTLHPECEQSSCVLIDRYH